MNKINRYVLDRILPPSDYGKEKWLRNFAEKLHTLAGKYNVSYSQLNDLIENVNYYSYWHNIHIELDKAAKSISLFKKELRYSLPKSDVELVKEPDLSPIQNKMHAKPTRIGFLSQIQDLVLQVVTHPNFDKTDAISLGLDLAVYEEFVSKPELFANVEPGKGVGISWEKKHGDDLELYVDRGKGFFFVRRIFLRQNQG